MRPASPRSRAAACYDADVSAADPKLDPLPHAAPAAGQILDGPHFNEPMRVETAQAAGNGTLNLRPEDRRECCWLYAVTNCATAPRPRAVHDPAAAQWPPATNVAHYQLPTRELSGEGRH